MTSSRSALKAYLDSQMELGDAEVFFDEPWTLAPKKPVPPRVFAPAQVVETQTSAVAPSAVPFSLLSDDEVETELYSFQKASSLNDFNATLSADAVYTNDHSLVFGAGALRPKAMLLFSSPTAKAFDAGGIWKTETGTMLGRLFEGLNIGTHQVYSTYFYKRQALRPVSPIIEIQLRKMLAKEIALVQPEVLVIFGETALQQVFGRGKMLTQHAGTVMEFAGVNTTALVDPYDMEQDQNLKRLTWNIHIPQSSFFVKR